MGGTGGGCGGEKRARKQRKRSEQTPLANERTTSNDRTRRAHLRRVRAEGARAGLAVEAAAPPRAAAAGLRTERGARQRDRLAAEPENVALDLAVEGGGDVEEKQGLLCGKQKNR